MLAVSTATFAQGCSDGGMVDTQDLKSCDHNGCAGSSPAPSTKNGCKLIDLQPFGVLGAGLEPAQP